MFSGSVEGAGAPPVPYRLAFAALTSDHFSIARFCHRLTTLLPGPDW
jgi:hypothetical protein